MKDLVEHISEAFGNQTVCESVGSSIIRDVFTKPNGQMNYYFSKSKTGWGWDGGYLGTEMQWDKITDSDVEKMSTEEARKLAYKKDSDAYILWLDPQGKFCARTIGNYMVLMDRTMENWTRRTVKSVSQASDSAIVIKNPEKFQTREIRNERRKMKENALALMDAADVAKANAERYKDLLRQKQLKDFNMGDIADQVKAVLDKYTDTVKTISTNLVASNDYRQVVRDLDGIDEDLQKVMSMFKQVVGRNVDYERYNDEKFGSIVQIYRERLTESVGRLNKLISQFNKKYGTGPDED